MPAVMANTGGGGGRWPSPAQNECFFMSPLQSYQGSCQGSYQGGHTNWRKQGECNKYIFTNAKLSVVRPAGRLLVRAAALLQSGLHNSQH